MTEGLTKIASIICAFKQQTKNEFAIFQWVPVQ